ncbi:hypothetical protein [Furfurilactobacillus milii]|uniref:Uncharacterized protein n=1 Tax=Furfurilactobacillus milii TaxID=2888272 RepID=A0A6N9I3Q7_9LACO|nr:hypothetical protein [Furfurilactobacillus milii]MYV16943.1 hypothetical protein [Furfurilactobacillus milii]
MPTQTRKQRHVTIFLNNLPWQPLLIFTIAQNIIWWSFPIHYGRLTGAAFHGNQLLLLAYTIVMSLTTFLMFQANFKSLWAHVPILISLILAFSGIIRGNLEILIMLLMFSGFWLVVEMRWLNLQNIWGLIIYALLSTFPISSAIFFFQNRFLSMTFLIQLIPLVACQLFFMMPIFETEGKRRVIATAVTGVLLIAAILFFHFSLLGVLAMAVVIITFWFSINYPNLKAQYTAAAYILLELITYLILVFA